MNMESTLLKQPKSLKYGRLYCTCTSSNKSQYFNCHHQWTLGLPHPLMSPEELDELMGGTEVYLMGTRVSP